MGAQVGAKAHSRRCSKQLFSRQRCSCSSRLRTVVTHPTLLSSDTTTGTGAAKSNAAPARTAAPRRVRAGTGTHLHMQVLVVLHLASGRLRQLLQPLRHQRLQRNQPLPPPWRSACRPSLSRQPCRILIDDVYRPQAACRAHGARVLSCTRDACVARRDVCCRTTAPTWWTTLARSRAAARSARRSQSAMKLRKSLATLSASRILCRPSRVLRCTMTLLRCACPSPPPLAARYASSMLTSPQPAAISCASCSYQQRAG